MKAYNYTFEEWKLGKFRLLESSSTYSEDDNINEISVVDLEISVLNEITNYQKQIFEEDSEHFAKKFSSILEHRLKTSKAPQTLINSEIKQCSAILFGKLPQDQNIRLEIWNFSLNRGFIEQVQSYYKRIVVNGETQNYNYISSLNDPYRFEEQDPNSYSEAIFRYLNYLKGEEFIKELKWPNEVFDSATSYELFKEFCKTILKKKNFLPDVCFIFHKMYLYKFILQQQTHKSFINFFNKEFGTNLEIRDLAKRDQIRNQAIFESLLEKHKS